MTPAALVLALLAPRSAVAYDVIDTTSNDTCATGESVTLGFFGYGHLESTSDEDWYCFEVYADGTVTSDIHEWVWEDAEFDLVMTTDCTDPGATVSSSGGSAPTVEGSVSAGDSVCIGVFSNTYNDGKGGLYEVGASFLPNSSTVTGMSPTTGGPGTVVTITGTNFYDGVGATLMGAGAQVLSTSPTQVQVRIPTYGMDGPLMLGTRRGRIEAGTFTYAAATPPAVRPGFYDPGLPDTSHTTLLASGVSVYYERFYVDFLNHASPGQVALTLSTFVAGESDIDGYTLRGVTIEGNDWAVDFDWNTAPDETRLRALMADLGALPLIESAVWRSVDGSTLDAFGWPTDVHAIGQLGVGKLGSLYAAQRQVAAEEAWRLYRYWGEEPAPETVQIVLLDTGLLEGNYGGLGPEFSPDPVDDHSITVWSYDPTDDAWHADGFADPATTRSPLADPQDSHGTYTTSVMLADNDGESPLVNGSEAMASKGTNGLLTGFAHLEAAGIPIDLHVVSVSSESVEAGQYWDIDLLKRAVWSLANGRLEDPDDISDVPLSPDIVVVPLRTTLTEEGEKVADALRAETVWAQGRLWIASSGNTGESVTSNQLFSPMLQVLSRSLIPIGGTQAIEGPVGPKADQRGSSAEGSSGKGPLISIVAPWSNWRTTRAEAGGGTFNYFNATGTSLSAPAAAAAAAFMMAQRPDLKGQPGEVTRILGRIGTNVTDRWYLNTALPPGGSQTPKRRLDFAHLVKDTLVAAGVQPDLNLYVYALDEGDGGSNPPRLWRRSVLASTDAPDLAGDALDSPESKDLDEDGCFDPQGVRVDPRGDVVYVTCTDIKAAAWSVHAYATRDLTWLGSEVLSGAVGDWGEFVVSADGVLYATSSTGSALQLDPIDTFHGELALPPIDFADGMSPGGGSGVAALRADEVPAAQLDPSGSVVLGLTRGDGDEDSDALLRFMPASLVDRELIETEEYDFSGDTDTLWLTDMAPAPDGSTYVTFLTDLADGTETELVRVGESFASSTQHFLDDTEEPLAITVDPTGESGRAWLAGWTGPDGPLGIRIDTADVEAGTTHVDGDTCDWIGATPRDVAFADNGQFVSLVWNSTFGGVVNNLHTESGVPTCDFSSAMSTGYMEEANAVAITPTLSVLSPRPGNIVDGVRRVLIAVRDPGYAWLEFSLVDESGADITPSSCTYDYDLDDGFSEGCTFDGAALDDGWVALEVSAWYDATTPGARLTTWFERR